jgi:4-hydroxyphenylacetate 3-monooxygenase
MAQSRQEEKTFVKSGAAYLESLRDGRAVYYKGEQIEDVTEHVATAGGARTIARLFDAQLAPESSGILTYRREDGARVTAAYMPPREKPDLVFRREGIEFLARQTFGTYGRGIDMIATLPIGMISQLPTFERLCPEFSENIGAYRAYAEENNIHLAEVIVDPQGYRGRGSGTSPETAPPERAAARIVRESDDGIWISGIKGVGTAAPQANEMLVGSFHVPHAAESFWVIVPVNAPGVRMYCRELTHQPGANAYDHPLDSHGEELEALVAFDEVFVPRDRILAARVPELHGVNFYNVWARFEHWYTFVRVMAKAELLAGLAQLVVDTLELGDIPVIRQRIGNILEFAQVCRGMAIAAEELAQPSEGGLLVPDHNVVTAGRSYALTHLPDVLHTIRDICGQGLILRFSEADFDVPAAFGKNLDWFLDTRNISAREKNLVMNLVWDVTSGAHATRSLLFEESNALNVPFLKERLYGEYDRSAFVDDCRHFIGLGKAPRRTYQKEIVQTWSREARD